MRDDDLVPKFYQALLDTGQKHVARMLGYEGLHTFVTVCITLPCDSWWSFVFITHLQSYKALKGPVQQSPVSDANMQIC